MTPSGTRPVPDEVAPSFGARLARVCAEQSGVCVGIDPHATTLDAWGLPDTAEGAKTFSRIMLDAVVGSGEIGIVKPQVAFFERFGSAGFAVLENLLGECRERGILTIADAKRGDIGSTAAGYAAAWLAPESPLRADAVTLSPYLGLGSLDPLIEAAKEHGGGAFILAATSNPEAQTVQRAKVSNASETVASSIVQGVHSLNAAAETRAALGSFGVVIGATGTAHEAGIDLAAWPENPGTPILAPGFGAQGASIRDIRVIFGSATRTVLAAASRSISNAGPAGLGDAIRQHVTEWKDSAK